jgi:hypothetical protein
LYCFLFLKSRRTGVRVQVIFYQYNRIPEDLIGRRTFIKFSDKVIHIVFSEVLVRFGQLVENIPKLYNAKPGLPLNLKGISYRKFLAKGNGREERQTV